jgi:hypothetical protein
MILAQCLSLLQHPEREFMLKFSAIEIYNEAVRDLLSHDTSPLRLLDDPEVCCSPLLELTTNPFLFPSLCILITHVII